MKDKDIIKALECCIGFGDCEENCPYYAFENCNSELKCDAIYLFECQKAEIERLQKAEAIKEFVERLKAFVYYADGLRGAIVDEADINDLVKEMVGDAE